MIEFISDLSVFAVLAGLIGLLLSYSLASYLFYLRRRRTYRREIEARLADLFRDGKE